MEVTCTKPDQRHAVTCIDAKDVRLEKTSFINPSTSAASPLQLEACKPEDIRWDGKR